MNSKQVRRRVRRELMHELYTHWHRCFWSWPWGHDWPPRAIAATEPERASRCRNCGKPYEGWVLPSINYFSERELLDLCKRTLDDDAAARVRSTLGAIPDVEDVL